MSDRCVLCVGGGGGGGGGVVVFFFFQAEDGIRDLVRSRGLGDVYKRQVAIFPTPSCFSLSSRGLMISIADFGGESLPSVMACTKMFERPCSCLLYTSDAADERSSVDLGGRRIINKTQSTNRAT